MEPFETGPDHLLRASDSVRAGRHDRARRPRAERGDLAGPRPGVVVPSEVWRGAEARERHLLRARAAAPRLGLAAAFSHSTAAALHGWASLSPGSDLVDVTDPSVLRSRRGATARVHAFALSDDDTAHVAGLPVTRAGRTAVDLASALPFRDAVVALDSALAVPRRGTPVHGPRQSCSSTNSTRPSSDARRSGLIDRSRALGSSPTDAPAHRVSR
ncbi:hypothetical protein GCM10025867_38990 [Frondihabitans sucicola]|uniref:Uncharacterized protein n=1 Tax=Frondihabitans sucicola TaxID=1268041 RepID=A0ABM8GT57_9MICO|nr:hypothetical protein [Frondihabitans sucicola]BDZ51658.1 hypothetical protein GCM10025867_38990 [Frondihabitans sucicola]